MENKQGKTYGLRFSYAGQTFKASEIGREFGYRSLLNQFGITGRGAERHKQSAALPDTAANPGATAAATRAAPGSAPRRNMDRKRDRCDRRDDDPDRQRLRSDTCRMVRNAETQKEKEESSMESQDRKPRKRREREEIGGQVLANNLIGEIDQLEKIGEQAERTAAMYGGCSRISNRPY